MRIRPGINQTQKGVVPGPDTDVTQVRTDLDLAAIRRYAASKGVRLWTWVHQAALRGRVEEAFAAFERIGWSGMMVDFFDHDDQDTVEFAEEILQASARHHILIHFHGVWKPTGWQRTYPNLMNHEGALNLEYLKWSDLCTPEHTLNLLFTRMVAGPMDYHAGGFRAVTRAEFKPIYIAPNVLGTRCYQLALVCLLRQSQSDGGGLSERVCGSAWIRLPQNGSDLVGRDAGSCGRGRRGSDNGTAQGENVVRGRDGGETGARVGAAALVSRFRAVYSNAMERRANSEAEPNRLTTETLTASSGDILRVRLALDGGFVVQFSPVRK